MQATQQEKAQPDKASMEIYVVIAFALVAIVGGVIFYNSSQDVQHPPSEPQIVTDTVEQQPTEPTIVPQQALPEANTPDTTTSPVPIEETTVVEQPILEPIAPELPPLPNLDDSDKLVLAKATQLSWLPHYASKLIPQDLLRNFVTFVDNLSRGDLATKFAPLSRPKHKFGTREAEGKLFIDEASYKRYSPYVNIINSINLELALEHYQRLMPLIDQAYMELGYEAGAFNQALVTAIELMLEAPVIRQPIELVAPSAMYKFKDQALEELPAAQKLMIRFGPDNATQLRPKLQQIQISLNALDN